jgi:glycine C-acetyltransferase
MYGAMKNHLAHQLEEIKAIGLWKPERVLTTAQLPHVGVTNRSGEVLNMCANNYLGLADHPEVVAAARTYLEQWGNGLASVRFICGTQQPHKDLEKAISTFLETEDTILYSSCWDANGGLFETILGPEDAVISDELNHASIIDGVRLCKAKRFRYKNNDMADLEARLIEAKDSRFKLIVTDGVFSMDGIICNLQGVCDLADKYDALTMVDDSHAVGFLGKRGRGSIEHCGVMGRVDIITGTLGKALGGSSGGYTAARKEIVAMLRQRSRPYLFSNSVAPAILGASLKAIEICSGSTELRDRLEANTRYFRQAMTDRHFNIIPGEHPITPIMLGDAALANRMSEMMLERGVYVIGFSYPVVPQGKARIRVQVSAAHSLEDLGFAVDAFVAVRDDLRSAE